MELKVEEIKALEPIRFNYEEIKSQLQEQLKKVIQELNQIEEDLVAKGEEVIKTTEDLKVAEETEKKQYADMKLRIKFMYEEGDTSMFETLVSSENFSDLVNKAEYVQNVHTYDRDKLQEYVETKEKVATLKASLGRAEGAGDQGTGVFREGREPE